MSLPTNQRETTINLCVTLCAKKKERVSNPYLYALAAQVASVTTHTNRKVHYYLIHDNTIDAVELEMLCSFIKQRAGLTAINVDRFKDIRDFCNRQVSKKYSPAIFWRLFIPDLVEAPRVILLDCDMLFLMDIAKIWEYSLEGNIVAAPLGSQGWHAEYYRALQIDKEDYFRVCIALFSLENLRLNKDFMVNRQLFIETTLGDINKIAFLPEQSVFNYFCRGKSARLPFAPINPRVVLERAKDSSLNRMIQKRNLILDMKGWKSEHPYSFFYWSYLLLTPFADKAYAVLDKCRESCKL